MATATKKAATPRKPRAASDSEMMTWKEIEQKYAGYYVLLANVERNPKEFFPTRGLLLGKSKTDKGLTSLIRKTPQPQNTVFVPYYVETEADKKRPRKLCIY